MAGWLGPTQLPFSARCRWELGQGEPSRALRDHEHRKEVTSLCAQQLKSRQTFWETWVLKQAHVTSKRGFSGRVRPQSQHSTRGGHSHRQAGQSPVQGSKDSLLEGAILQVKGFVESPKCHPPHRPHFFVSLETWFTSGAQQVPQASLI